MALRRHSGTAIRNHPDGRLREKRLNQQSVGNHADIGAEARQSHLQVILFRQQRQLFRQFLRAECGLVDDGGSLQCGGNFRMQFPAWSSPDAVYHGQFPALLSVQVVLRMGVTGRNHVFCGILANFFRYPAYDGLGFRRS